MEFVNLEVGTDFDFAILSDGDDTLLYEEVPAAQADLLSTSPGTDAIVGLGGNDVIANDDTGRILFGNAGADVFDGGAGVDTIAAGRDNDVIRGGGGGDILFGNLGIDIIDGGEGDDIIFGGQDGDTLIGNVGNDTLSGDRGNDVIQGNLGDDVLSGGEGADLFTFGPGDGVNVITDFEDGTDVIGLIGSLRAISFSSQDGNAVAILENDVRVILAGISPSQLDIFDFTRAG